MQAILTAAIDSVLDVDAFNAEVEAEKQDAAHLLGVRNAVHGNSGSSANSTRSHNCGKAPSDILERI